MQTTSTRPDSLSVFFSSYYYFEMECDEICICSNAFANTNGSYENFIILIKYRSRRWRCLLYDAIWIIFVLSKNRKWKEDGFDLWIASCEMSISAFLCIYTIVSIILRNSFIHSAAIHIPHVDLTMLSLTSKLLQKEILIRSMCLLPLVIDINEMYGYNEEVLLKNISYIKSYGFVLWIEHVVHGCIFSKKNNDHTSTGMRERAIQNVWWEKKRMKKREYFPLG